jgi:hypothetical protein
MVFGIFCEAGSEMTVFTTASSPYHQYLAVSYSRLPHRRIIDILQYRIHDCLIAVSSVSCSILFTTASSPYHQYLAVSYSQLPHRRIISILQYRIHNCLIAVSSVSCSILFTTASSPYHRYLAVCEFRGCKSLLF